MDPETLMRQAIEVARRGIALGQSPFGCAIARAGELLACRHNTVLATPDSTAHAEINALRTACLTANAVHCGERSWPQPANRVRCAWPRCTGPRWNACTSAPRLATHNRLASTNSSWLPAICCGWERVRFSWCPACCARIAALFQAWLDQPRHTSY